jgi:hypothetical protein
VQFRGEDYSFSLIDDGRPLTEHVHLAFPAREDATVRAFHAAALADGHEDHGGPGERTVYHPGYYAAFVLTGTTSKSSTTTAERRNVEVSAVTSAEGHLPGLHPVAQISRGFRPRLRSMIRNGPATRR